MKRVILISFILGVMITLTACAEQQMRYEDNTNNELNENLFEVSMEDYSQPEVQSYESEENSDNISKKTKEEWQEAIQLFPGSSSVGFFNEMNDEEGTPYYIYDGNEAEVNLYLNVQNRMNAPSKDTVSIGIILYLDGQIQPYRVEEETEYSYIHTFYPESNVPITDPLYFIPRTGSVGETLELEIMSITWPDYWIDECFYAYALTGGTTGMGANLVFNADPPALDMPSVMDRVKTVSISVQELSTTEIEGWTAEDLRSKIEFHTSFAEVQDGSYVYGFNEERENMFHYEIWGNPVGEYGLVLFVNNLPASVQPEDLIYIQTEEGKKTCIDIELDLSDFDGEMTIYPVLVSRNYFRYGFGNGASEIFMELRPPYYISDQPDFFTLMGWEKE